MPEESTTPDLVELVRKQFDALNRRDLDEVMSSVAEDGVLDGRADLIEGRAAIRGFLDEWFGAYEELNYQLEEVSHLGGGVVFAVAIQDGRLVGSDGRVRQREGWVYLWVGGSIARLTTSEVDEARAAAERLAEERGWAMSENLDLVRSIYADWERGDFRSTEWADPEIELVIAEGLDGDVLTGLDSTARGWREWLSAWEGYRAHAHEYRVLDGERVLVLGRMSGRGRMSGVASDTETVNVFHVRDGKVARLALYRSRPRAFADLGLTE